MTIQFGNGSGVGGSKIDAKTTAMQENATRFICEQFIEKNKFPKNSEIEKIYPDYDEDWHNTFTLQATTLKTYLTGAPGGVSGYSYSRDVVGTIMPFIEDIAINKCGVRTKDSWNPADIYIVRTNKERDIKKEIKTIGDSSLQKPQKLTALNDYMRTVFKTK